MAVYREELTRIANALHLVEGILRDYSRADLSIQQKPSGELVTEADLEVDRVLRQALCRGPEGWLSEETVDDYRRLREFRTWIVDPLDGTKEFTQGIPEWCVSIGLAEAGQLVAGGIANPLTSEVVVGSMAAGVTINGDPARVANRTSLSGATVLASRSEVGRGQWERFRGAPFHIRPVGSIAYKLALVAIGKADLTASLEPKNEWDIAAGALLVEAAGGKVTDLTGECLRFNRPGTLVNGIVAGPDQLVDKMLAQIGFTSDE